MTKYVAMLLLQFCVLLLLIRRDKDDGERDLFRQQQWKAGKVVLFVALLNGHALLVACLAYYAPTLAFGNLSLLTIGVLPVEVILFHRYCLQPLTDLGFKWTAFSKTFTVTIITLPLALSLYGGLGSIMSGDGLWRIGATADPIQTYGLMCQVQLIVSMIIGSPVEEIVFRGIAYAPYRRKYGPGLAIFFTAVLFFAFHLHFSVYSFPVGLLLAFLYEKTQSFSVVVTTHIAANVFLLGIELL